MMWGAIASFILAAFMAILVGLGIWHARRVTADVPLRAGKLAATA